jgi:hypothetical protein
MSSARLGRRPEHPISASGCRVAIQRIDTEESEMISTDKTLEIVASVAMLTGLGAYLFAVAVLMLAS